VVLCVVITVQSFFALYKFVENIAVAYNNDALALMYKGKNNEALEKFNSAIGTLSTNGLFFMNRGTLYYKMGKYPEALKDLTQAIRLDQSMPNAYANRAYLYKLDLRTSSLARLS